MKLARFFLPLLFVSFVLWPFIRFIFPFFGVPFMNSSSIFPFYTFPFSLFHSLAVVLFAKPIFDIPSFLVKIVLTIFQYVILTTSEYISNLYPLNCDLPGILIPVKKAKGWNVLIRFQI